MGLITKVKSMMEQLKALRILMIIGALLVIVMAPSPGSRVSYEGWQMVTTLLIPTLAPLVFMVLLLDALMGRVWLIDAQGTDRDKFKTIIRVNLFFALLLLLVWVPYFVKLWN